MTVGADGAVGASDVYRALVRNQAKLAYDAVAAWLDGRGPRRAAVAACPGSPRTSACRTGSRRRMKDAPARARRSEPRDDRGARRLRRRRARRPAAGREEPRQGAHRGLHDRGQRRRPRVPRGATASLRCGASCARPERWDRIVELAAGLGDRLPAEPTPARSRQFLVSAAPADPRGFPTSRSRSSSCWAGRVRGRASRRGADGHFGLAVRDYTHSTAPNRRFPDLVTQRLLKAALAGDPAAVQRRRAGGCWRATAPRRRTTPHKVERQVSKSAAALLLAPRVGERFDAHRHRRLGEGDLGAHLPTRRSRGAWCAGPQGLDVGDRVRVELSTPTSSGLHRLRARDEANRAGPRHRSGQLLAAGRRRDVRPRRAAGRTPDRGLTSLRW